MKTPESLPALVLDRTGIGLVFVAIDRDELIDFLLRRDFGSLPPPVPKGKSPLDRMLDEATRQRNLRMAGLEDPRPAIDRRRGEYQALSDESLLALHLAAKEEDEKQAESVRKHAEFVRAGAWPQWAKKDLWSQAELAALCCGLIPDDHGVKSDPGRTNSDSIRINSAIEQISRGVLSKSLECISHSDVSTADRLYWTARHFRPIVAVEWAQPRFGDFPADLANEVRKFSALGHALESSGAVNVWPWGAHETKLLKMLAEAAKRYWQLYDPADPSTAPENETVAAWLESQGVAERNAKVMATMLRADGLRPGRRK